MEFKMESHLTVMYVHACYRNRHVAMKIVLKKGIWCSLSQENTFQSRY